MVNKVKLDQTKLGRRRRRVFIKKTALLIFLFLMLLASLYYFLSSPGWRIEQININGNQVLSSEDLKENVSKNISGSYFYTIPKDSIFFYPKKETKKDLKEKFTRIKNISIERSNLRELSIFLSERQAKYLSCQGNSNNCFFADEDGFIFAEAPNFSEDVYFEFFLPAYSLKENKEVQSSNPIGYYLTSPDNLKNILGFKESIQNFNLEPSGMYDMGEDDVSLFFAGNSEFENTEMYYNLNSDPQEVADNLGVALSSQEFQTILNENVGGPEYIDLRFSNKVYYKFD